MTLSREVFLICSTFLLLVLPLTLVSSTVEWSGVVVRTRGRVAGAKDETEAVRAIRAVARMYLLPIMVMVAACDSGRGNDRYRTFRDC